VTAAPMNDLDADYTPRYVWLANLLRGWIEDGTYPPGSLLPSSARLAAVHGVSRATALHALEILTKSGHARHVESNLSSLLPMAGETDSQCRRPEIRRHRGPGIPGHQARGDYLGT
jgi:DNA-binding transcriptional MocR family regulator